MTDWKEVPTPLLPVLGQKVASWAKAPAPPPPKSSDTSDTSEPRQIWLRSGSEQYTTSDIVRTAVAAQRQTTLEAA
ncbi:hypothetical protein [Kitasatospora sp. Ki12]